MLFNEVVKLVTEEIDDDTQKITGTKENEIFCEELPVQQSEFYKAAQNGLRAELRLLVNKFEYNKELFLIYKNEKFKIYRVYTRKDDNVELYCMAVII